MVLHVRQYYLYQLLRLPFKLLYLYFRHCKFQLTDPWDQNEILYNSKKLTDNRIVDELLIVGCVLVLAVGEVNLCRIDDQVLYSSFCFVLLPYVLLQTVFSPKERF